MQIGHLICSTGGPHNMRLTETKNISLAYNELAYKKQEWLQTGGYVQFVNTDTQICT